MSLVEGRAAEAKAALYLQSLGYAILTCNFYSKFGEIDIIAQKDGIVHFCEVKYSAKYDPLWRITPSKFVKITRCIDYYWLKKGAVCTHQIDAILVTPQSIEIIKNISC